MSRCGEAARSGVHPAAWCVALLAALLGAAAAPVRQGSPRAGGGTAARQEVIDFINGEIRGGWEANKLRPSASADDAEFVRRAYLDVVGRIPTVSEAKAFLAEKGKQKRAKLVDALLDHEDYAKNWATIWSHLLVGRAGRRNDPDGMRGRNALHKWLRDSLAANKPYDKLVYELVGASGHFEENGATNFLLVHLNDQAVPATARVTRLFLGMQIQCTQCHNHPFNDWKQERFWQINAFFRDDGGGGTKRRDHFVEGANGQRRLDYSELVDEPAEGPVYYEQRDGLVKMSAPTLPGGQTMAALSGSSRRVELAKWMSGSKNPYLAPAIVNRMWAHLLGRGFTTPVDDMGSHNAASHPALLEGLAKRFGESGYDLKELIRWITGSEAYPLTSRSTAKNADDHAFFTHMAVKPMTAEQLYDSLIVATGAHKAGRGSKAAEEKRQEWLRQFVFAFGNDENAEATLFDGTVPQALMMMNGELMRAATSSEPGSFLHGVMEKKGREQEKLIELYLAALSRYPTPAESRAAQRLLTAAAGGPALVRGAPRQRAGDERSVLQDPGLDALGDIFWALLNSNEFILNH